MPARACAALCFLMLLPLPTFAQGETALGFLRVSPSPEADGMAGTTVAFRRADPLASVFSPMQTGLAALTTGLRIGIYPQSSAGMPSLGVEDLTFGAWSAQGGLLLNDVVELPLRVGVGIAYHRVEQDLGTFTVTGSGGPVPVGEFESYERATGVVLGVGVEYLVRAGFGFTFRSIESNLSPVGTEQGGSPGKAEVTANDYGATFEIPIVTIAEKILGGAALVAPGLRPWADVSVGVAWNNMGDAVTYSDPSQADPSPRTGRAGVGVQGGLTLDARGDWEILSLAWSREAEDLLVIRHSDGTWDYQSGLGDLDFTTHVIAGKSSDGVGLRAGWQVAVGELFTIRRGSVQGNTAFTTDGFSVRLAGALKAISYLMGDDAPDWLRFAREHIDFQYHNAAYEGGTTLDEATFQGMTLALTGLPL